MRGFDAWDEFKRFLDRVYPKRKDTAQLSLFHENEAVA